MTGFVQNELVEPFGHLDGFKEHSGHIEVDPIAFPKEKPRTALRVTKHAIHSVAKRLMKKAPPHTQRGLFILMPGSDLLSHGKPHTTIGDASFHC